MKKKLSLLCQVGSWNEISGDLCATKAVNFKYSNLKITACAQWRIVERQTTICFPKSNIFIHPYGLAFSVKKSVFVDNLIHSVISSLVQNLAWLQQTHPINCHKIVKQM